MRYLAIGDIHGCIVALRTLIHSINLHKDDIIITLGDYVDKGEHVPEVLDWLVDFKSHSNLISLKGNHDIMMSTSRDNYLRYENWLSMGGASTIKSYGNIDNVPDKHWQFLQECQPYFEIEKYFFVHANAYSNISLSKQPDYVLYWQKLDNYSVAHQSGKIMICGHSAQKNGLPLNLKHSVCVDTWACGTGWLTCLDIFSGEYWQANEQGQVRTGLLS